MQSEVNDVGDTISVLKYSITTAQGRWVSAEEEKEWEKLTTRSSQEAVSGVLLPIPRKASSVATLCWNTISYL